MYIVVAYDVVQDRRRNRVMKLLKNHGRHVQYSVFECDLRAEDFRRMYEKLKRLVDPAEDNVRFYFLDRDAVAKIEELGQSRSLAPDRTTHFVIL